MNLLAIETSTETVSVALRFNGELIERYSHSPRKHAELLLPWVESVLDEAGTSLSALDAMAFSRGPGSFTSLRIGIGVVQGLAWASDLPVVPISSLATVAQVAAADGVQHALIALDARMGEVFTGTFALGDKGVMRAVDEERVCSPKEVTRPVNSETVGLGIGFARYPELNELGGKLAAVKPDTWPKASAVIELAVDWLSRHEALPAEKAQPVYLRNKVAEKATSSR